MKIHPISIDIHFHDDCTVSFVFGDIPIDSVRELFEALATPEFQEYFIGPIEEKYRSVWEESWEARLVE